MANYLDTTGLTYFWGKIKAYIAGLGFYTKPSTGIPASDIASGVIPTVPTNLSSFTDDLGSSPTHTHSQYLTSHQNISGKADKVTNATSGNFASLDSNGNLTDSGHKHSDYLTSFTETDPVFTSSVAHGITASDIITWNKRKAQSIPFGEVDNTSVATAFTATVEGITTLQDGVCCYLKNTVVASAAAADAPKCWTLNINNLGAKPVYVTTAAATYSTTQFAKNYKMLFTYDASLNSGSGGWYIGQLFNSNTTYSDMTQKEITAGTGTTGRKITPKMLRDNFYTEDEVDGLLDNKQDTIDDLATIRSGAALGATALQSYTETDPTVPAWAKASTKPSYTALEVGAVPTTRTVNGKVLSADITLSASDVSALPSNTVIPSAPGTLNTTATTAQSTNSSEALSGSVTLHKIAKTGTYSDLIGTPTIPTVPANLIIGTNGNVTNIQVISDSNYNSLLLNGTTDPTTLYIITAS